MFVAPRFHRFGGVVLLCLCLLGCFQAPFNNFKPPSPTIKHPVIGTGVGALVGALAGGTGIGLAVGGGLGVLMGLYQTSQPALLKELSHQDIQFVDYGDTLTLVVPTDHYFLFNEARFDDRCYVALNNIIRLLKFYPQSRIYVAGFTDDVGSKDHRNRLSQARAEAMLAFLWANDIPLEHLHAYGYRNKYTLGDDHFIRGSAYNRRIEIQWFKFPDTAPITYLSK